MSTFVTKFWRAHKELCESPWTGERKRDDAKTDGFRTAFKKPVAVSLYALLTAVTLLAAYAAVTYNATITSVEVNSNTIAYPDVIFCPRSNFAIYPQPLTDGSRSNASDVKKVYVHWLRRAAYVARARDHEHYANNLWYNLAVIEALNLTVADVDIITNLVRFNASTRPYRKKIAKLLKQLKGMLPYPCDQKESNHTSTDWTQPLDWHLWLHPHLHHQLYHATELDLALLWHAIIQSRYVLRYSLADHISPLERRQGGTWSRRFACDSVIDCYDDQHSVWLDNNYCVIWKRSHRPIPATSDEPNYYPVDIADEMRVWIGNVHVETVAMDDFREPSSDSAGWLSTELPTRDHRSMMIFNWVDAIQMIVLRPIKAVCQPLSPAPNGVLCPDEQLPSYWLYQNKYTRGYRYTFTHINTIRVLREIRTMTVSKALGASGCLASLLLGLSVAELASLVARSFTTARKNLRRIQMFVAGILITIVVGWTLRELSAISNQRYIKEPLILSRDQIAVPNIRLGGSVYSRLTLNHTKLIQYNVTPSLLEYMSVAATARSYYAKWHTFARFRKLVESLWEHPWHLELVSDSVKPSAERLNTFNEQYSALANMLHLKNSSTPQHLLSCFFLDKCRIIVGCGFESDSFDENCCNHWDWRLGDLQAMSFALEMRNTNPYRKFQNRNFFVLLNVTEYLVRSDAQLPYLGPDVNYSSISKPAWNYMDMLTIGLFYDNSAVSTDNAGSMQADFGVHHEYRVSVIAEPEIQLADKPNASCSSMTPCTSPASRELLRHEKAVQRLCACSLCQSKPALTNHTGRPTSCCEADQLVRCVLQDRLYQSYCASDPSKSLAFGHVQWLNLSAMAENFSTPNIFTNGYTCSYDALFSEQNVNSPLRGTVLESEMDVCRVACGSGKYDVSQRSWLTMEPDDQHYNFFKITIIANTDLNLGTREIDVLQPLELTSVIWGMITMLTGATVVNTLLVTITIVTTFCCKIGWKKSSKKIATSLMSLINFDDSAEDGDTTTGQQPPLWHMTVYTVATMLLVPLAVSIVVYMVFGTYDNHVMTARSKLYSVRLNSSSAQMPDIMLCAATAQLTSATAVLAALARLRCENWLQRSTACSTMLPIYWQNHPLSCALSQHPPATHLDPNKPVFSISGLRDSPFTQFWLGDSRTLTTKTTLLDLYDDRNVTEARFEQYQVQVKGRRLNCVAHILKDIPICKGKQESSSQQLCAITNDTIHQYVPSHKHTGEPCEYNEFRYFFTTFTSDITLTEIKNDQIIRVKPSGRLVFDVSNEPRFNWAQQLMVVGGVFDSLVSVSVFHVVFAVLWNVLRLAKSKVVVIFDDTKTEVKRNGAPGETNEKHENQKTIAKQSSFSESVYNENCAFPSEILY